MYRQNVSFEFIKFRLKNFELHVNLLSPFYIILPWMGNGTSKIKQVFSYKVMKILLL